MALKRSTCSEGAESGGLAACVIRLSFTGRQPAVRAESGPLIVFALLVEDVRVGAGLRIVFALLVEDARAH
jgi:hypothetical protein